MCHPFGFCSGLKDEAKKLHNPTGNEITLIVGILGLEEHSPLVSFGKMFIHTVPKPFI